DLRRIVVDADEQRIDPGTHVRSTSGPPQGHLHLKQSKRANPTKGCRRRIARRRHFREPLHCLSLVRWLNSTLLNGWIIFASGISMPGQFSLRTARPVSRRAALGMMCAAALAPSARRASAQDAEPIKIVIAFPPGGTSTASLQPLREPLG